MIVYMIVCMSIDITEINNNNTYLYSAFLWNNSKRCNHMKLQRHKTRKYKYSLNPKEKY